ncbi:MAG: FHA domain-containing protein [Candidatus Zixiibacteriota bacterium]
MPEIVVKYEDKVIERVVTQKKRISIGRTSDNDIVLDNKAISRKHAQIEFGDDSALIIDNESLNGTFVNNRKINEEVLKDNDEITIGKFNLIYHLDTPRDIKLTDLDGTMVLRTKKQKKLLERDKKEKEITAKAGCSVLLGEENTNVKQFLLDKPVITFGKSKYVNIKVKGLWVSKIQAKITKGKDGHVLMNLGRRGKTKVNGEEILRYQLKNDDLIEVGKSVFRFIQGKNK